MADILISEFMDEEIAESLIAEFDVYWDPLLWKNKELLKRHIANSKAIIVRNDTLVDAELLESAPNLKIVARMGVGLDTIDLVACKKRNIEVCPSIGANAVSVAEYVISTAMILLRGPSYFATNDVISGVWDRPRFAGSREISGLTMGIIGFGSIGKVVAEKALALNMKVIAYDSVPQTEEESQLDVLQVEFDELIRTSDIISIHCPKISETINLINKNVIKKMKNSAILINSARGGIINERDCAQALRNEQIAGAALDSFDIEPILPEVRKMFEGINNLILTPHIAGVTKNSNRRIAEVAAQNVRRVFSR